MNHNLFLTACGFLLRNGLVAASILTVALLSAHAQDTELPGPEGGEGFFGLRVVRDNGSLSDISDAETSLASHGGDVTDAFVPWINHSDPEWPGTGGLFAADDPFPGNRPGDDNNFAWLAKGNILIREPGFYTFGFDGDDGQALWLEGANFTINGGTGSVPDGASDMFWVPGPSSRAYTTASTFLAPGVHKLGYLGWEGNGRVYTEAFSATGDVNFAQWLLIGDSDVRPEISPVMLLNGPAKVVNASTPTNATIEGAKPLIHEAFSSGEAVIGQTDILVLTDGDGICCGRPGVMISEIAATFPIDDTGQKNGFSTKISGELIVDDGDQIPGETLLLTILLTSDDGSQFHVLGQNFIATGSNGSLEIIDGNYALTADFLSGNTDTYGIIELTEGVVYPFDGWHFEVSGDAGWEIWASPGDYRDDFSSGRFAPVSSAVAPLILPANNGLALVSPSVRANIEVDPNKKKNAASPYNINSSKQLKVAVFSTADFDAAEFSGGLFTLSDPDLPNPGFAQTHSASVQDLNNDGLSDLLIDFGPAKDIATKGAISVETIGISVVGISGSKSFEGRDKIKILGK